MLCCILSKTGIFVGCYLCCNCGLLVLHPFHFFLLDSFISIATINISSISIYSPLYNIFSFIFFFFFFFIINILLVMYHKCYNPLVMFVWFAHYQYGFASCNSYCFSIVLFHDYVLHIFTITIYSHSCNIKFYNPCHVMHLILLEYWNLLLCLLNI